MVEKMPDVYPLTDVPALDAFCSVTEIPRGVVHELSPDKHYLILLPGEFPRQRAEELSTWLQQRGLSTLIIAVPPATPLYEFLREQVTAPKQL